MVTVLWRILIFIMKIGQGCAFGESYLQHELHFYPQYGHGLTSEVAHQ